MYKRILNKLREDELIRHIIIFTKGMGSFKGTLTDVANEEGNINSCYVHTNQRVFIVSIQLKS